MAFQQFCTEIDLKPSLIIIIIIIIMIIMIIMIIIIMITIISIQITKLVIINMYTKSTIHRQSDYLVWRRPEVICDYVKRFTILICYAVKKNVNCDRKGSVAEISLSNLIISRAG